MAKYLGGDIPQKGISVQKPFGNFWLVWSTGLFSQDKIDLKTQLNTIQEVTDENKLKLSAVVGWGFIGTVIAGPVGTVIGSILGGKKNRKVIACELTNGYKCLLEVNNDEYLKLISFAKNNLDNYIPKSICNSENKNSLSSINTTNNLNETLQALKQLGELRDLKIISNEEFEEKKSKLMNKI